MGLRGLLAAAHECLHGDEFAYVRMAQALVGASPGAESLSQPVLLPIAIAAMHGLVPDWEMAARLVSLTAALLTLGILPFFSRELFDSPWAGLGAALTVSLYPPLVDLGARPMTEPLYDLLLVLAAWQAWRAITAKRWLFWHAGVLGVALGLCANGRREGIFYVPLLAGLLFVTSVSRRGWFRSGLAFLLCASLAAGLVVGGRALVKTERPTPSMRLALPILGGLAAGFLLLLGPALLLPAAKTKKWGISDLDRKRFTFFLTLFGPVLVALAFPDPGRKITAIVPIASLLVAEAARRLGQRRMILGILLQTVVLAWFVRQGLSASMRLHLAPPWRDAVESRQAAEWLNAHSSGQERVVAYGEFFKYYSRLPTQSVDPHFEHLENYVRSCQRNRATYVVVDRRPETRYFPMLNLIGDGAPDHPGLELVAVFLPKRSPLNEWLRSGLPERAPEMEQKAVLYRLR